MKHSSPDLQLLNIHHPPFLLSLVIDYPSLRQDQIYTAIRQFTSLRIDHSMRTLPRHRIGGTIGMDIQRDLLHIKTLTDPSLLKVPLGRLH